MIMVSLYSPFPFSLIPYPSPQMQIDVITLFPEVVTVPLSASIMGRAREKGMLDLRVHDLREHGIGKYRQVDDEPYGGGPGMVMRPEPIFAQLEQGKTALTFGFTEAMSQAGHEVFKPIFAQINPEN